MNLIEASFGLILRILRVLRLYRSEKSTNFRLEAYLLYFLFICLVPVLALFYFPFGDEMDFLQLNFNATFVAETMGFIPKLLPFISKEQTIRECINYFTATYFETSSKIQRKIVDDCAKVCRRNSLVLIVTLQIAVFSCIIRPFMIAGQRLPFDVWLPFDPRANLTVFYCVYTFLAIAIYYMAVAGTIVDPLIGGLLCQAATHMICLQHTLQHLYQFAEEEMTKLYNISYIDERIKSDFVYNKIKECIQRHNAILKFINKYEDCFSFAVFSQFAASTFAVGLSCLQISMMPELSINTFIAILCVFIPLAQIYFYCFYGSMLFEECSNLTTAVYMSEWYEFDVRSKKALMTIMESSQKPMIVTAGKILDLSLATFTTVVKRSYSLLAVLQNISS